MLLLVSACCDTAQAEAVLVKGKGNMTDNGPDADHEGLLTGDLGYEWEENCKIKTCVKKTTLLRFRPVRRKLLC